VTEKEARDHLERLMFATQRVRSMALEEIGDEQILEKTEPWLFGPRCIIIGLEKILKKPSIEPGDLYNMMVIAQRSTLIQGYYLMWSHIRDVEMKLLKPDVKWFRGWDPPAGEPLQAQASVPE